jgi:hypothetical protein
VQGDSIYSLRIDLDDAATVHFTFRKNPPGMCSLLRLGPCCLKSNPFFPPSSLAVVAVRQCPSTPPYAPSRRVGDLYRLVFPGQWGGEELPFSPSSSPAIVAVRSLAEGRAPLPLGIPGPVGRRGFPERLGWLPAASSTRVGLGALLRQRPPSCSRRGLQEQLGVFCLCNL